MVHPSLGPSNQVHPYAMSPDITPADRPLAEARLTRPLTPWREFFLTIMVLVPAFIVPLYRLVTYSMESGSLYSHVLLIPFVSLYLVWIFRKTLPEPGRSSRKAAIPFLLGAVALLLYLLSRGDSLSRNDFLSVSIGSFYCFFLAAAVFSLGTSFCRQILFPLAFLVFIIPLPEAVTAALETASKLGSAEAYALLMNLAGTTYYR